MADFELTSPLPDAKGQADADHYPTPPLLAQRGVELAVELYGDKPGVIVEPGCSECAPFASAGKRMGIESYGLEIREGERTDIVTFGVDYLEASLARYRAECADIIITNPPFSLAVEFIETALYDVSDSGLVMMLLQTGIEGSKQRREFWEKFPPVMRYVIRPRPGFVKGGNDSREYAFYVWLSPAMTRRLNGIGRVWTETRFLDNDGPWGRAE